LSYQLVRNSVRPCARWESALLATGHVECCLTGEGCGMVVPSRMRDRVPSATGAEPTRAIKRYRAGGVQVAVPIAADGPNAPAEAIAVGKTTIRAAVAITRERLQR
jgi:hypothetical protein